MSIRFALAALVLMAASPTSATPCADEVSTLQRRLDSAGATAVTGKTPPGGTTTSNSDKALASPPSLTQSDAGVKPTASGVEEAKTLVAKASAEDKAGDADACRETIRQAKAKAGALP